MACTSDGILMVESQATELSEEIMLKALEFGHGKIIPIINAIKELSSKVGKKDSAIPLAHHDFEKIFDHIQKKYTIPIKNAYKIQSKKNRQDTLSSIKKEILNTNHHIAPHVVNDAFKKAQSFILRQQIIKTKKRIDGRGLETIRPINCQVGLLPKTHGSALFTRGETQALAVVTLGTNDDEQMVDGIAGEYFERFFLHYNFPPYSVGEVGRLSAPGRRELGHGRLAWKALASLIPSKNDFSYTIRLVSEITESNGSSSMATVCSSSLALMDAGVPLEKPVAGIAMGLIKEGKNFSILSDIMGDEDHLGDMDFKVAGTRDGITALQMDLKIDGIAPKTLKAALNQAIRGLQHITQSMNTVLNKSKPELSDHAPKIKQFKIAKEKIRDVIGMGGKVIRDICDKTGAKIDISDEGLVTLSAVGIDKFEQAISMVDAIVTPPTIGSTHTGTVIRTLEFGAIVAFAGHEGMVHISEISKDRIKSVEDVLAVGQVVTVKVIGEERGKIKLSMKALNT
jgi:polyribonucleotide nucleotidyltransferase